MKKQQGFFYVGWFEISIMAVIVGFGVLGYSIYKTNDRPASNTDATLEYAMDKGLEGCTVHYLHSRHERDLYVVRCPNSSTTTQWEVSSGKTTTTYSATVTE